MPPCMLQFWLPYKRYSFIALHILVDALSPGSVMNATAPLVVLYAIDECENPDSWEALPEVLAEGAGTALLHTLPLTWCIVTSNWMSSSVTLQYTYPPAMVNECMAFQKHDVLGGSKYYRSNKKRKSTWPNSRTVFTNSASTFGPQLRAPIQYTAYPNDTAAFIFWKLKNNCMVLEWNIPPSLKLLRIPKLCQAKELSSGMFYSTCITIVIVIESFHILDNPRIKGMVCRMKRVRVSESCFAMRCVLPPSRWSSEDVRDTTGRMAFAWSFHTDSWMNKIVWIKSPDTQNADYTPGC